MPGYADSADPASRTDAQRYARTRIRNVDLVEDRHGFILVPGAGWRLSEAYDMNPDPGADGLNLNITEHDNALSLKLAREVADVFRLRLADADDIIDGLRGVVRQWRVIADGLGLPQREQERMADAFRLA